MQFNCCGQTTKRSIGFFTDYEKADSSKKEITGCRHLSRMNVHAQIEEEIFYPAFKAVLKDKLLISEATIEHGGIKDLITQLEGIEPEVRRMTPR